MLYRHLSRSQHWHPITHDYTAHLDWQHSRELDCERPLHCTTSRSGIDIQPGYTRFVDVRPILVSPVTSHTLFPGIYDLQHSVAFPSSFSLHFTATEHGFWLILYANNILQLMRMGMGQGPTDKQAHLYWLQHGGDTYLLY